MTDLENEENPEDDKTFISRVTYSEEKRIKISNNDDIHKILADILHKENKIDQEKEHLWFIGFNSANYIMCIDTVALGTVDSVNMVPMNVFRNGVWKGCTHAILAHNHPSLEIKPSKHDIDVTDRLYQCGLILELPIRDHLIITLKTYYSFEEHGLMAKILKSIKFKPNFKIVEDMKAEAEKIRKQAFAEGKKEGLNQGKIIGVSKRSVEIAKKMLLKNKPTEEIIEFTGLTADDIDDLKKEMK